MKDPPIAKLRRAMARAMLDSPRPEPRTAALDREEVQPWVLPFPLDHPSLLAPDFDDPSNVAPTASEDQVAISGDSPRPASVDRALVGEVQVPLAIDYGSDSGADSDKSEQPVSPKLSWLDGNTPGSPPRSGISELVLPPDASETEPFQHGPPGRASAEETRSPQFGDPTRPVPRSNSWSPPVWRAPLGFRKRVGDTPLGAYEEDYPPVGQIPARCALEEPLSALGNGEPPSPDYVSSSGSASPSPAPFGDGERAESTPLGPFKENFATYTRRLHRRVSLGQNSESQKSLRCRASMPFSREQPTVAHRSGEHSSQTVTRASSTHFEAQKPTCTKDDTCDLISNAEVPVQELNEVSPPLRFYNVPVGAHVTQTEPPRRNSIIVCFTGDRGAPGGFPRSPSSRRSGASRDSGAIMRRFSFRWCTATGDQNPINHRQSMDRPAVASGAPDDVYHQEGINRSPVDAQEGIARKGNAFSEAARRFAERMIAGEGNKSFHQRFRRHRAPEDVATETAGMEMDTTDEGSAEVDPDQH